MNTQHTPGPWSYHLGRGANPRFHIQTSGGYQIASTTELSRHFGAYEENAQREANARLIAAAPELLEALISLERGLNDLEEMCRRIVGDIGTANVAREKADWCRAAIAKATQP